MKTSPDPDKKLDTAMRTAVEGMGAAKEKAASMFTNWRRKAATFIDPDNESKGE